MLSTSVAAIAIDACFLNANILNSIASVSLPITMPALPELHRDLGECSFQSQDNLAERLPCDLWRYPPYGPWQNLRYGLCRSLRCGLGQHLPCELLQSHLRERSNLGQSRPRVLRLRVPVHRLREGCRQAPRLPRSSSLAVS
jgi:hypothetical protein